MTLRDYGRFGQFILDGARVNGQPIVPDNWLAEATRTQVSTGAARARATAISGGRATMARSRDAGSTVRRCTSIRARRLVIVINSATEQPTTARQVRRGRISSPRSTRVGQCCSARPRR